ncbi:MAG: hypothetical protein ACLFMT_02630 [Halobacteriales archaeon]
MSAETSSAPDATTTTHTTYRTATYMACESCHEGAMVWDPALQKTRCHACGDTYDGRPTTEPREEP